MNKTRDEISKEECTSNPIFLFQRGTLKIDFGSPVEYNHDLEEIVDLEGNPVTNEFILDNGYGNIEWSTEHVWYTREEAEQWGNEHAYRYRNSNGKDGVKGIDWQVYCTNCCGELVTKMGQ